MQPEEYRRTFELEGDHWWYVAGRELVLSWLDRIRGARLRLEALKILDVGCGTGLSLNSFQKNGFAAGLDTSPIAIEWCKRRGLQRVLRGSATHLPIGDLELDVVVCLDVIYHQWVDNDAAALREFGRALKPGGHLVLQVPAFEFLRGSHDSVVLTARRYTHSGVLKLLRLASFTPVLLTYRNALLFPGILATRIAGRLSRSSRSNLAPVNSLLNALWLCLVRLENRLIAAGIRLPVGSSAFCVARKG